MSPRKKKPARATAPVAAPVETPSTRTATKVLDASGRSFHGGACEYPLPTARPDGIWEPGSWLRIVGSPELCERGFHLTRRAAQWWATDARAWLAEYDGKVTDYHAREAKFAVQKVRLLRPLTTAELEAEGVFLSGDHKANDGFVTADGNATVTADGNATVTAYGNATVTADGNATVRAYGNATVRADGNATVTADGNATVRAYGNATVTADGNATVRAWISSKTHVAGRAVCTAVQGETLVVTRSGDGVIVDRRGLRPVAHVDGTGLDGWRFVDGAWVAPEVVS